MPMSGKKKFHRPESLTACLDFLRENGSDSVLLAGGTDVMVDLKAGEIDKNWIVDVSRLQELKGIEMRQGRLWVGAGVTLTELLESEVIHAHGPALQKSAFHFAAKQIRNVATIGGNVAHCSPCADTLPPLLVHEAQALIAGSGGTRSLPVDQVAAGPYLYGLKPDEVILGFSLRPRNPIFADFQKIGRRRELVIARVNMAGLADLDERGGLCDVRFALGSCTPVTQRFQNLEEMLEGQHPSRQLFWEAGALAAETMINITGRRPSFVYKEKAVQGLFYRMFAPLLGD